MKEQTKNENRFGYSGVKQEVKDQLADKTPEQLEELKLKVQENILGKVEDTVTQSDEVKETETPAIDEVKESETETSAVDEVVKTAQEMTKLEENLPDQPARTDMPLDKQIKNLQVSISIYRKEIKNKLELLPTMKGEEKAKAIARIAMCDKQIIQKETELVPLKAMWAKEKPHRAARTIEVSPEEVQAVLAKYNIQ